MARGSVYKRCPCGTSGTAGRPACRKSHGSWWWRAEATRDPVTLKRRQPAQGGYATKAEAADALSDYVSAQNAGTWVDDRRTTVAEWLRTWLDESAHRLDGKTLTGYRSHAEHVLIPHLGSYRLRDLRRSHIEAMIALLSAPGTPLTTAGRGGREVEQRMPRTLDSYRRTLRAALAVAKRRGLVAHNVAEGRIEAIPRLGRPNRHAWEPDEVAAFLRHVQNEPDAALYDLAAFAGLRRSELLGLRWCDVDLDGRAPGLWVLQVLSGQSGPHECISCGQIHRGRRLKLRPKTAAGVRWVPLVPDTIAALKAHRAAQDEQRAAWGDAYSEHDLVFALENGEPLRPDAVTKRFEHLADAVRFPQDERTEDGKPRPDGERRRLPRIVLHEMRHGACSLLIAAGVPIELVRKIAGHASEDITREWYAHALKGPASEGMRAAVALVRGGDRAQSVHRQTLSDLVNAGGDAIT